MRAIHIPVLAAILALAAAPAAAQHVRYVASDGSDTSNVCATVTAPCRTIQRAFQFTATGGEIRVLNSGNYGIVGLTRSMTVAGDNVTLVGGFVVNGEGVAVTLQGLTLNGVGVLSEGVRIIEAAAVHIEGSTIERFTGPGIVIIDDSELYVLGTDVRNNGGDGLFASGGVRLTIDGSRFENNGDDGVEMNGVEASIARADMAGNADSGIEQNGGRSTVAWTTSANNGGAGYLLQAFATMALDFSIGRGNGVAGFSLVSGTALVSDSTLQHNLLDVVNGAGSFFSCGNNRLGGQAGPITPCVPN